MKYLQIILIALACFSCKKSNDPYPYTFHSIKNYDDTEVEVLAKYVKKNDTISIVEFLKDNPNVSIDTKDRYFGHSLLMFAIFNGKYEAFHCLLNHGADFNTKYYGRSPADDAIILIKPEIAEYLIIEKKALIYNHPFWKSWEGYEDPKFASSLASSRKRIINYLKEHPEQLMYNKATKSNKDSIQ